MFERMTQNWVYSALPMALILLLLSPFVAIALPVFLALPVYMIHQFEEHDADRFRLGINAMLGSTRRGLGLGAVWLINVVFVWFLLMAVFWLMRIDTGWGVTAGYLLAINAVGHIAQAVKTRAANPGLVTSIILFLPLAAWIFNTQSASMIQHLAAAAAIIVLHAGIAITATRPAI